MKKHNKTLNTYHKKLYVCMTLLLCLFFMFIAMFFASNIFAVDEEPTEIKEKVIFKNNNPIDLNKIIKENTSGNMKEEMVVEEIDLEYTTRYKNNSELASGVVQVLQEGRVGTKNAVVIKKYQNDELIAEQQVAENIIKAPVERIVEIGTGALYHNYKVNEGDTVYVVSTSVSVRLSPDENSEKICTLNKDDSARVLKIEGDWYFISTVEIRGYIPSNCVTTKNPNQEENDENIQFTKQQLEANLSFDMDLRKPSGLTLEQFKKVLSGDSNDKKSVFESNAEYFYYAEKQYKINGIFVASVGIHESGWGTSSIANNKKNLFGYGAVDSNPYGGSYSFSNYAEGIDLISRVFVKYYLNPPGTVIYDGTTTSGKFYSGSNLSAVNSKYASDKNWANSVYKWMQYLYNKI